MKTDSLVCYLGFYCILCSCVLFLSERISRRTSVLGKRDRGNKRMIFDLGMSGMLQEILLCPRKISSRFELLEEKEKFREEESKQVQEEFIDLPYKRRRKYFLSVLLEQHLNCRHLLQNFVWRSSSCLVSLVSISALSKFGTIKPVAQYLP